jgi:hypothetical protein
MVYLPLVRSDLWHPHEAALKDKGVNRIQAFLGWSNICSAMNKIKRTTVDVAIPVSEIKPIATIGEMILRELSNASWRKS